MKKDLHMKKLILSTIAILAITNGTALADPCTKATAEAYNSAKYLDIFIDSKNVDNAIELGDITSDLLSEAIEKCGNNEKTKQQLTSTKKRLEKEVTDIENKVLDEIIEEEWKSKKETMISDCRKEGDHGFYGLKMCVYEKSIKNEIK